MATTYASDFIDDGYSVEKTLVAETGEHGELAFTYRPATADQVARLIDTGGNDQQYIERAVEMLATEKGGLLLGWNLKDRHGEVVKVNRGNLARVRRKLLVKIIRQVFFEDAPEASLKN